MAESAAHFREPAPPTCPPYSLEALLQALHEFVIVLDCKGFVQVFWSLSQCHGRTLEIPLLGRRLSDVLDRRVCERLMELSRCGVDAGRSKHIECSAELADGVHHFAVHALPAAHAAEGSTALCLVARDVTDRKRATDDLRKSEALLAQAEQLANMGSFDVNVETGEIRWSAQLYRAFKLDPAETQLTKEFLWQRVHPDDRERVRRDVEMQRTRPQPFEHEARWIRSDGAVRTMYTRGVPVIDASDRVIRLVGISQDVTERKDAETRLRKSEALLAQAERIANFGSWELDLKTRKFVLSEQLSQMLDVSPDAGWTKGMYWEKVHRKDRRRTQEIRDVGLAECKPYEYVARYHTRDRGVRFYFVRGVPVPGPDGKTERVTGFLQDITDQTRAEEDLRRLSRELIRARDDERRHMARELHESAGQSLAALKMTLGRLRDALPEHSDLAHELLQSSTELAEGAIREVRTISYLMYPPLLDEAGLGPALRWYVKGFAERSGIEVEIEIPEDFGRVSQEIETTLFRIVQEALTNVHRYSGSRTAKIRLTREDRRIRAEVRDEGCGLAMSGLADSGPAPAGVGIAGMRERVKQLNGIFEVESTPGRGTTVRAILPVAATELPHRAIHPPHVRNAEGKQRRQGKHATC
jgi:signal transduction histidine kinase